MDKHDCSWSLLASSVILGWGTLHELCPKRHLDVIAIWATGGLCLWLFDLLHRSAVALRDRLYPRFSPHTVFGREMIKFSSNENTILFWKWHSLWGGFYSSQPFSLVLNSFFLSFIEQ